MPSKAVSPSQHNHQLPPDILITQPFYLHPSKPSAAVLAETEAQWLFTRDELASTPSIVDGMPAEQELELRGKGLNFINQVGIMLKLPQITISAACLFFNRFLMRNSLVSKDGIKVLHHYQIAGTALFVATKSEENSRKLKELIIACCRVAQKNPTLLVDEQSKDFWRWRDTLLLNEDVVLESLCFDVSVESAHKVLFDMLKELRAEHNKGLRSRAWGIVNDASLTMLGLRFSARAVAAMAMYLAARVEGTVFEDDDRGRPWWATLGVRFTTLIEAANSMVDLYEKKHANGSNAAGSTVTGNASGTTGTLSSQGEAGSSYVGLGTPSDQGEDTAATRLKRDVDMNQAPSPKSLTWEGPSLMGTEIAMRDAHTLAQSQSRSEQAGISKVGDEDTDMNGREKQDDQGSEEGEVEE